MRHFSLCRMEITHDGGWFLPFVSLGAFVRIVEISPLRSKKNKRMLVVSSIAIRPAAN